LAVEYEPTGVPGERKKLFTVVCGDMNLLPDSETFAILGRRGLVDLVGTADTRTSAHRKPLRHANYMLVSHPDTVASFATPATPEVSDHRALILDLAGR
jgi:endonuclease/exonuclease/phosphatase family metal-dependent hydrolase